ncbi:dephospho-CoA kinase [Rhodoferax aquaticus]|uniref:Dephospho-CoA kinase n=1 Tax=Rhodoferax aquaticus TaxID=2527691 RepID=A0A515ESG9_9BURK|nr:dephospho-CoA kinase [Rhodoferax aquaticus]QDL55612.1 dephospho-CoA kinase [Rhodoferax aquaticus]
MDAMPCPKIGVTGGIGSGKSTIAKRLAELGAGLVDADLAYQTITGKNATGTKAIAAAFGPDLVGVDGRLERKTLRELVFADPIKRTQLESITHPLIRAEMDRLSTKLIWQGATCIVYDIPLLVESNHWRNAVDAVLVVDCSQETQACRVKARNGWSTELISQAISAQSTRLRRLSCADYVIFNDGVSLDEVQHEVDEFARKFGL